MGSDPQCHICGKPADQTGSHVFTWSLIKSLVNKPGYKDRGNEVVFSLSRDYVKTYVGSGQSTEEKVIPIKGRPLTDEEIEESIHQNPFVRDFILCRNCEKMLSVLENEVIENVISKLREHKIDPATDFEYVTVNHGELLRLFIYSLAWRGAITRINDFEMLPVHQEGLRSILCKCLSLDREKLMANIEKHKDEICSVPLVVTFCETKGENNNWIYCSLSGNPYAMLLNELGFQMFFEDAPKDDFDQDFRGINKVVDLAVLTMKDEATFQVGILSDAQRLIINQAIAKEWKNALIKNAIEDFSTAFKHFIGRLPRLEEVQLFLEKATALGNGKVEILTPHDLTEAASTTMQELFPGLFKE